MKITKEIKDSIIARINAYEYNSNALKYVNGGYIDINKLHIVEYNTYYEVYASVTVGDMDKRTIYDNCKYYLDKKDFHLLTDEEYAERTGEY